MYITYHLKSAAEITSDMAEAIKLTFKNKPIVLTVEEETDATAYLMSDESNKNMLKKSLRQAKEGNFIEVKSENL